MSCVAADIEVMRLGGSFAATRVYPRAKWRNLSFPSLVDISISRECLLTCLLNIDQELQIYLNRVNVGIVRESAHS